MTVLMGKTPRPNSRRQQQEVLAAMLTGQVLTKDELQKLLGWKWVDIYSNMHSLYAHDLIEPVGEGWTTTEEKPMGSMASTVLRDELNDMLKEAVALGIDNPEDMTGEELIKALENPHLPLASEIEDIAKDIAKVLYNGPRWDDADGKIDHRQAYRMYLQEIETRLRHVVKKAREAG